MILVSLFLYGFTATHAFVVRNDVVRDDDAAAVSSVVRMRDPPAPPNRRPENTSGKIATVVADQEGKAINPKPGTTRTESADRGAKESTATQEGKPKSGDNPRRLERSETTLVPIYNYSKSKRRLPILNALRYKNNPYEVYQQQPFVGVKFYPPTESDDFIGPKRPDNLPQSAKSPKTEAEAAARIQEAWKNRPGLKPVDSTEVRSKASRWKVTLSWGIVISSIPVALMWLGHTRRNQLRRLDEERQQRVLDYAQDNVSKKVTWTKWPSEYEGDIFKLDKTNFEATSDEGVILRYDRSKITSLIANIMGRDNVFFSVQVNLRVLSTIVLGVCTALLSQYFLVRCGRNECTEDEFKADVEEIAHVFKELKNVSYIFTPMLALFLGFYMSFAVSRNSEWLNDAIGGVWVGAVNLNMVLATHLRGEEYDLIKKGVLRWTLCIWEDTFDATNMSLEDYDGGVGLEMLKRRGLLLA
jgi:hypothetical protein